MASRRCTSRRTWWVGRSTLLRRNIRQPLACEDGGDNSDDDDEDDDNDDGDDDHESRSE